MDFPAFLSLTMLRMISATIPASMSKTITVPILLPPFLKNAKRKLYAAASPSLFQPLILRLLSFLYLLLMSCSPYTDGTADR
jgi:hypothetical protein